MVEEPTGDKLEERGVRGERRGSGFSRERAQKVTWRISSLIVFPKENHRLTGSAASTLVVSRRWEFLFERPLWRDRVQLRNFILIRKGRGLGRGVGSGLVLRTALGGFFRFCCKTNRKP